MLSGWGGDELASSNGRAVIGDLLRRGRLATLWRMSWARRAVWFGRQPSAAQHIKGFAADVAPALPPRYRIDRLGTSACATLGPPRPPWPIQATATNVGAGQVSCAAKPCHE